MVNFVSTETPVSFPAKLLSRLVARSRYVLVPGIIPSQILLIPS